MKMRTLTLLLWALAAISMPEAAAREPERQYGAGEHRMLLRSDGYVLTNGAYALAVAFEGARAAAPTADASSNGRARAASLETARLDRVSYAEVWPGIDITYDAPEEGILRSTWTLRPGADPGAIRLRYNRPVSLTAAGQLTVSFDTGTIRESAPIAWQDADGRREPVEVAFMQLEGDLVGFRVGAHRPELPLTIDPTVSWLTWRTFLGGAQNDQVGTIMGFPGDSNFDPHPGADAIAVDGDGNVYVAGTTETTESSAPVWPDTPEESPWCPPFPGFNGRDAFVAKLSSDGALQWYTHLASQSEDEAYAVAVDCTGNVYVAGRSYGSWACGDQIDGTVSPPPQNVRGFVVKLNPTLPSQHKVASPPIWIGSEITALAVECSGRAWVSGRSFGRVFVARIDDWSDPSPTPWPLSGPSIDDDAPYAGGQGSASAIVVEEGIPPNEGAVYVAGTTRLVPGGSPKPFAAKFSLIGDIQWFTRFLGSGHEAKGIAVDEHGSSYVVGDSGEVAFVVKLGPAGNIIGERLLGTDGLVKDSAHGVAVDPKGRDVYVVGYSDQGCGDSGAANDACLAVLSTKDISTRLPDDCGGGEPPPECKHVPWSTRLGGDKSEWGNAITLDGSGNLYILGYGQDGTWDEAQWGTAKRGQSGSNDLFVLKMTRVVGCDPGTGCDDSSCLTERMNAWGTYLDCVNDGMTKAYTENAEPWDAYYFRSCRSTYFGKWNECFGASRFKDNDDGTVTDNLSGLTWETKTDKDDHEDLSNARDADNRYTWSKDDGFLIENGTVFTSFLESLNAGGGFAGANGWRLPTIAELMTIFDAPERGSGTGMVSGFRLPPDPPVFALGGYWSATSDPTMHASCSPASRCAWNVMFDLPPGTLPPGGAVAVDGKTGGRYARAVRGGL